MRLGIGIDTGGTYTDAVVYDFDSASILGSAKALTTRDDLTVGILGAIDALPSGLARQAEVISLSTTLATNACVEGKSGRAKLIFFGGDRDVIARNGRQYGLPSPDEICIQESFTSFSGRTARDPDWEQFERDIENGFENLDGVGIVEMNATRNGAQTEKKAKEIFMRRHRLPVVCGHELFSELNSLKRGASTLLNAGLFPVISEFLGAVRKALDARDIHPESIVIVRSDGSLMNEEFASLRPVETLLCGPAASAIGCAHLAQNPDSIVVDMGGTTTDIAFIRGGTPVTVTNGVSIGKWKTFVSGLYVKTFGLGGDSAVHYDDTHVRLEECRVVPLCVAAKQYPSVTENLRRLEVKRHTRFLYEHYMLMKDIEDSPRYNDAEKALCRALKDGPLLVADAAQAVGRDIYTLNADRLLHDGIVQLCGLTPTDFMHIRGDFTAFDAEASRLAAQFAAFNLGIPIDVLCDNVYNEVKKKLYANIVKAMLENRHPHYMKNGVDDTAAGFIAESWTDANSAARDPLISSLFRTRFTLIGAGAPIRVFLEDVAAALGTDAFFPENYSVANALGAIMGSVSATCSIEIKPVTDPDAEPGYIVFAPQGNAVFKDLNAALAFASEQASSQAREEALRRGARGEIAVSTQTHVNEAKARTAMVHLGTIVTAHASGSMGFW